LQELSKFGLTPKTAEDVESFLAVSLLANASSKYTAVLIP
jgi:hypothetical protein